MAKRSFNDLEFVQINVDDCVVGLKNMEKHVNHLIVVCDRVTKSELKIKLRKCVFGAAKVGVLGYIMSVKGVAPDQESIR